MTVRELVFRYTAFAAIATLVNLGTQRLVLAFGTDALFYAAAVAAGTLTGLVVKYILDKRWIFGDMQTGLKAHGRKFTLYTIMGVFTTAIFWSSETAFWFIWKTDLMREVGAIAGLAVGYFVKYQLDRRFVFSSAQLATDGSDS
nr:GtrA family protein [uncultured Hyphomonas sp.]